MTMAVTAQREVGGREGKSHAAGLNVHFPERYKYPGPETNCLGEGFWGYGKLIVRVAISAVHCLSYLSTRGRFGLEVDLWLWMGPRS
jgi:hypothetical protein